MNFFMKMPILTPKTLSLTFGFLLYINVVHIFLIKMADVHVLNSMAPIGNNRLVGQKIEISTPFYFVFI